MKTSIVLTIAFLSISTAFAQKSTIEKDLKMYEQVWNNIVNKRQIERINEKKYSLKDTDAYGPLKWKEKTNIEVDKLQIFQEIEFENILDDFLYRVVDNKSKLIELDTLINKILKETEND